MALAAFDFEYAPVDKDCYTEDEYLALEDNTSARWEFVPQGPPDARGRRRGLIRAMSGGLPDHSRAAANLIASLTTAFRNSGRRTCRPFGSDLKLHCPDGRNTYPDLSVVCGPLQFYRERQDIILNPVLLAEVLSPSTEADDRGSKWSSYQAIPSLKHYLLMAADRVRVEIYTRTESGWRFDVVENLESEVHLEALEVSLSMADLYDIMDFQETV